MFKRKNDQRVARAALVLGGGADVWRWPPEKDRRKEKEVINGRRCRKEFTKRRKE